MRTVWQSRMTGAATRYGEHAPMAATCCNACRACVQTNLVSFALAAVIGVGAALTRVFRRDRRTA